MKNLEIMSTYYYDLEIKFNYNLKSNPLDCDALNNELDNFEANYIWNKDIITDIILKNIIFVDEVYSIKPDISSGDSYYDFENSKLIIRLPVKITFKNIFNSNNNDISDILDKERAFSKNEDIIIKNTETYPEYSLEENDYCLFI